MIGQLSCPWPRSHANGRYEGRRARSPRMRAATCAASAPNQRCQEVFYGMGVGVRIVKHHTPQKIIDEPLYASIWMCRPWTLQQSMCTYDAKDSLWPPLRPPDNHYHSLRTPRGHQRHPRPLPHYRAGCGSTPSHTTHHEWSSGPPPQPPCPALQMDRLPRPPSHTPHPPPSPLGIPGPPHLALRGWT